MGMVRCPDSWKLDSNSLNGTLVLGQKVPLVVGIGFRLSTIAFSHANAKRRIARARCVRACELV